MYFFVRFTGIIMLIVGVLLMVFGVGTAIYGFAQHDALMDLINNYWLASTNMRFTDVRFYAAFIGLSSFLGGMLISALGQLLLIFADLANNTKETNLILRGLRSVE